ncbi:MULTISPECIES: Lrp/AsnC family transcriptional regulator [Sporomusa]|jgi:DNA-binding Lrp family transcriptional regulator|uniref:siroheme decarboxylase subunit alpha n=1 Tax=Sporomusa TaxID=2375 RepID=UPI0020307AE2|nr:Lrp/AsnC family transcriptional regulator [Sporomusa sphaeroides]MCM0758340.1 Lrp/AsnC family transcriptional regulator [Sporomusa sphaeroides DSM 2875]HML34838.1 Lrp/AsnC family transcriptional regulator [Sporomusa sphaeroides]
MLTPFDKELLNIIQTRLPLESRPYAKVAQWLEAEESTVLERLNWLKDNGYIRRFGAFFDSACLGYVSTLAAVKVRPEQVAAVAQAVNAYSGVTHNYERESEYNLWFTLLTADQAEQDRVLAAIRSLPGVEGLLSLPAIEKYKVSVEFSL